MSEIPTYFISGMNIHNNFPKVFEEMEYFKDKEIKILHLGAYNGDGTRWMLEHVNGSCVDVDVWQNPGDYDSPLSHQHYDSFYTDSNVESSYDQAVAGLPTTKFKGTTKEFFEQNKETFDFIYIDASHKKADVASDLEESWKVLNTDGIIACDDYFWHVTDPTGTYNNGWYAWNVPQDEDMDLVPYEAINEFIDAHKEEVEVLVNNYQFWFKKI